MSKIQSELEPYGDERERLGILTELVMKQYNFEVLQKQKNQVMGCVLQSFSPTYPLLSFPANTGKEPSIPNFPTIVTSAKMREAK